jgi:hypothetical protein
LDWYKDIDVIDPADYFKKIHSFSFNKIIILKKTDSFEKAINLDCFKAFTKQVAANNFELLFDIKTLLDYQDHTVPYDYFLLDLKVLEEVSKETSLKFLLDFVSILDTSINKFKLLTDMYYSDSQKIVIKLSRVSRNIGLYPILEQKTEILLNQIEYYAYDLLNYSE